MFRLPHLVIFLVAIIQRPLILFSRDVILQGELQCKGAVDKKSNMDSVHVAETVSVFGSASACFVTQMLQLYYSIHFLCVCQVAVSNHLPVSFCAKMNRINWHCPASDSIKLTLAVSSQLLSYLFLTTIISQRWMMWLVPPSNNAPLHRSCQRSF